MQATDRRMLTDAVITSSSESILDFVIHCVYISEISRGNIYRFTGKTYSSSLTIIAPICFENARAQKNPML